MTAGLIVPIDLRVCLRAVAVAVVADTVDTRAYSGPLPRVLYAFRLLRERDVQMVFGSAAEAVVATRAAPNPPRLLVVGLNGGRYQGREADAGTEQFWSAAGIEPVLALRASWVSQDDRWDHCWANRPDYVS